MILISVRRSVLDPSWPIFRSLAAAGRVVVVGAPIAWPGATAQMSTP
jgi:hypothetical protein